MNCKQGDLAIVVPPGFKENLGKAVRCLKLFESNITPDGVPLHPSSGNVWVIDRPVLWKRILPMRLGGGIKANQDCLACDDTLMPISPPDNFKDDEEDISRDEVLEAVRAGRIPFPPEIVK